MGDKGETSVNYAAQGTQSGRQGGDKCKLMRPKESRVGEVGETSGGQVGDKYKLMGPTAPGVRQVWETSGRQL